MRKAKLLLTVLAMSAAFSSTALAGTWQPQDNGQWKYQNDDGSFATGWIEESGKNYYLNADGIMLSNTTTPDGYYVGADGAWDGNEKSDGSFFSKTGRGDQVVSGLTVTAHSYLHFDYDGDRNFIVHAHYGDGKYDQDLLVNKIGEYSGDVYIRPGDYTLEIQSSGHWSVKAYPLAVTSDSSFYGSGDSVTPLFMPTSTVYNIGGSGDSNFIVYGYYGDGKYDRDLLVNTIGTYSGTVLFKHKNAYSFFEIICDGSWSITPQ